MKLADIKIGEEYLVGPTYLPDRGLAVAIEKVNTSQYASHPRWQRQVRVRLLNRDNREELYPAGQVLRPWAEEQKKRDAEAEYRAARKAEEKRAEKLADRLEDQIGALLGTRTTVVAERYERVALPAEHLAALVARARGEHQEGGPPTDGKKANQ